MQNNYFNPETSHMTADVPFVTADNILSRPEP